MDPFMELKSKVAAGLMVRSHSAQVRPGEVFVAMPGTSVDGARFVRDALDRGAGYVVGRPDMPWPKRARAEFVPHEDPRQALGELAAAYFDTKSKRLTIIGVTGTNGKTTVAFMLEHLLSSAGRKVGLLGTVSYRWPGFALDANMTTPDCWQTHELLSNMAGSGVDTVVMEVSSHALDQRRVAGLDFNAAVLTNVTQDHLDYHGTMNAYFRAKSRLFDDVPDEDKACVVNTDDPYGRRLAERMPGTIGFGLLLPNAGQGPWLSGSMRSSTARGLRLAMAFQDQRWELESPLIGRHNASNLLAAQAVGLALGLKPRRMKALAGFRGVPGRLERVENARGMDVFVDYAHTPDALENVLHEVRELDFRRLLVVFGCGGNRDRTKRPLMGEAVCRYADVAVLTSDNPRDEDPLAIMADVKPGLTTCAGVMEEPDRRKAIAMALNEMRRGDVCVIAGKGHETYQEVRGERRHFSDAEVVRELLK